MRAAQGPAGSLNALRRRDSRSRDLACRHCLTAVAGRGSAVLQAPIELRAQALDQPLDVLLDEVVAPVAGKAGLDLMQPLLDARIALGSGGLRDPHGSSPSDEESGARRRSRSVMEVTSPSAARRRRDLRARGLPEAHLGDSLTRTGEIVASGRA